METEEASDRYVAPCFINGLEAYYGEINLGQEENMISNKFAVKLCLDNEFIINLKEDDVEPGVVLGRLFMRVTKGIARFGNGVITIYPELDPFLDSFGETEKTDDDWDLLLDNIDFGDILEIEGVEIPPFVCKIGKNSRNKRKELEKYQLIYSNMGPSLSTRKLLTQEEAAREALAINICNNGEMKKEEEEAIIKVKGEALIEKEDPGAFVIPIRLEAKIDLNALANTSSDINVMPFRIYKELGRKEVKPVNRGITMSNHSKAEPIGYTPIIVGRGFLYTCGSILNIIERITSTFDRICHQTFRAAKTSLNTEESDSDDEEDYGIQRNSFGAPMYGLKPAKYLNCHDPLDRYIALQEVLNPFRKICVWKKVVSFLGSLPIALQHED
ncbi:hypothetical protein Tco_1141801 [Tanacetum coccineum]